MHALVFVCDVVGAVVVRDGEALDARQVRELADAGHVAALADGVDRPEPEYLGQALALEEAVYAPDLDEEGPSVGGGREAEAEEQGAVLAEGGALYVYGIVVLAHEAGPLLLLLFAAFYGGVDEGVAGLFAERYEVNPVLAEGIVDETVEGEGAAGGPPGYCR